MPQVWVVSYAGLLKHRSMRLILARSLQSLVTWGVLVPEGSVEVAGWESEWNVGNVVDRVEGVV